ncbi:hypothetical protein ES703_15387 [subsurface metagenome]
MRIPRAPPAIIVPTANSLSYPRLSMAGSAIIPIDTVAAPLIPTIAAKIAQIITTPTAKPPLTPPAQVRIVSNITSAIPALWRIIPVKIKPTTHAKEYIFCMLIAE